MTKQACAEFFAKVNTDAALQQEVDAALEGKEDTAAATAFVEVGAKHGYEFTAQEAAQKHQEIIAAADDGEIEEEALENVAGGRRHWDGIVEKRVGNVTVTRSGSGGGGQRW
ncbi:Nif11 family protein [Microcoleus sp. T2B6]|uniref:Nif11 family protein n=1 Tax=Microcoleus sp. T2B6 TaxID=3055424 RepID=UPI002FD1F403